MRELYQRKLESICPLKLFVNLTQFIVYFLNKFIRILTLC